MWDPEQYLRYADERSRPFADLLARVGAQRPRAVVDLGCGPGTLTAGLAERFPGARVTGIDSSERMIARAAALSTAVRFRVGDLRDWSPDPDVDLVVSHAALQWVPDHPALLRRWIGELPAGAWLAVQVPGNSDAESHRALRAVAADPRWAPRLADAVAPRTVPEATAYADLAAGLGCAVDAWETTYVHVLPVTGARHPVLTWMEGTALRPVRAVLDDAEWARLRDRLDERLARSYPATHGRVLFPFRRIFVVARTPVHP